MIQPDRLCLYSLTFTRFSGNCLWWELVNNHFKFVITNIQICRWVKTEVGTYLILRKFLFEFINCSLSNHSWTHIYVCFGGFPFKMMKFIIHGKLSEMLLSIIGNAMLTRSFGETLQNIWSTRLHERLTNLVGRVILEKFLVCALLCAKPRKTTPDGYHNDLIWLSCEFRIKNTRSLKTKQTKYNKRTINQAINEQVKKIKKYAPKIIGSKKSSTTFKSAWSFISNTILIVPNSKVNRRLIQ